MLMRTFRNKNRSAGLAPGTSPWNHRVITERANHVASPVENRYLARLAQHLVNLIEMQFLEHDHLAGILL